jgi:hypothetical protein
MAKYNEDIILTGCDDGYVRAVNVLPNKVISIVNDDADEEDSMPVSKITIKNNLVAFTCNDDMVRIYDVEGYEAQVEEEEETTADPEPTMKETKNNDEDMKQDSDADKQWEDIEDEIDSGDSDSEEEKEEDKSSNLFYTGDNHNWSKNKFTIDQKKRKDFFSDM